MSYIDDMEPFLSSEITKLHNISELRLTVDSTGQLSDPVYKILRNDWGRTLSIYVIVPFKLKESFKKAFKTF